MLETTYKSPLHETVISGMTRAPSRNWLTRSNTARLALPAIQPLSCRSSPKNATCGRTAFTN